MPWLLLYCLENFSAKTGILLITIYMYDYSTAWKIVHQNIGLLLVSNLHVIRFEKILIICKYTHSTFKLAALIDNYNLPIYTKKIEQETNNLNKSSHSNFTQCLYRVVSAPDRTIQIFDHYTRRTTNGPSLELILQTIFIIGREKLYWINLFSFFMSSRVRFTYCHLPISRPQKSLSFLTKRSRPLTHQRHSQLNTTSARVIKGFRITKQTEFPSNDLRARCIAD